MSDYDNNDYDPDGMAAAKEYARWHLGYESWAYNILNAYFNPEQAMLRLAREKGEDGDDS